MIIWKLRKGLDRRFRGGHPWVYSNELAASPKGIEPGSPVELRDAGGAFLARGYGNPSSLISFRSMTRDEQDPEPCGYGWLLARLVDAVSFRRRAGLYDTSCRICFAEADCLPGLVIDRYVLAGGGIVHVLQAQTAGMDRLLDEAVRALEEIAGADEWARSAVVVRNDAGVRKLEGLELEKPRVVKMIEGADEGGLRDSSVLVRYGAWSGALHVDLLEGQKTGLFLDQNANIASALGFFAPLVRLRGAGQWGSALAALSAREGVRAQVVAVDASAAALEYARRNIEAAGADCITLKADVFEKPDLSCGPFELVVADPPALIKGRKDIEGGKHAYMKLYELALGACASGAGIVLCSCSALLEENDFAMAIAKASRRSGRSARWVARGGQAPDHPVLPAFPEGRYLKCWTGTC